MISDPIKFDHINTWHELLKANIQKLMFYTSVSEKTLSLAFVVSANYPVPDVRKIFSICPSDKKNSFTIGNRYASREEFLEYLGREYPEHLEWLLFHQEWLK